MILGDGDLAADLILPMGLSRVMSIGPVIVQGSVLVSACCDRARHHDDHRVGRINGKRMVMELQAEGIALPASSDPKNHRRREYRQRHSRCDVEEYSPHHYPPD